MRHALLIIDMINRFDFDGGPALARHAATASSSIQVLRATFHAHDWPVLFVNDNFMDWNSEFSDLVTRCRQLPGAWADCLGIGATALGLLRAQAPALCLLVHNPTGYPGRSGRQELGDRGRCHRFVCPGQRAGCPHARLYPSRPPRCGRSEESGALKPGPGTDGRCDADRYAACQDART